MSVKSQLLEDEGAVEGDGAPRPEPRPLAASYFEKEAMIWTAGLADTVQRVCARYAREEDRFRPMPDKFQEMMPKLAHALCLDLASARDELREAMGHEEVPSWSLRVNQFNVRGAALLWLAAAREDRWLLNLQDAHNYAAGVSGQASGDAATPSVGAGRVATSHVRAADVVDPKWRLALLMLDIAIAPASETPGLMHFF